LNIGLHSQSGWQATLADFKALAPQSTLFNQDLSSYEESSGWGVYGTAMFNMAIGINFRHMETNDIKPNPQLRLGVSYINGRPSLSLFLHKEERWAYDTLISTQTGDMYFIDSVSNSHYHMDYACDQLRLDVSMIWRTNPLARWSLFAGVGVSVGTSVTAVTQISYSFSKGIDNSQVYGQYTLHGEGHVESFSNGNNLAFAAALPMGIDWRIGKKSEFLSRLHVFYEVRPGIHFLRVPELGTNRGVGIQQAYGLRVSV
jgi:hypothetical protein